MATLESDLYSMPTRYFRDNVSVYNVSVEECLRRSELEPGTHEIVCRVCTKVYDDRTYADPQYWLYVIGSAGSISIIGERGAGGVLLSGSPVPEF